MEKHFLRDFFWLMLPLSADFPPTIYHSSPIVSRVCATSPLQLLVVVCVSPNPIMGPDWTPLTLTLTTLFLFSGLCSYGLGSRPVRITAPAGHGSNQETPSPAVQLLFQDQHVSGLSLSCSLC
ncbi:hypothetical protein SAY87_000106 [Trapa incisa]|uniref:Uncharacterized protein n=1 Tax=Trapa incisa TaxID=236973 RepID=A0AAN7JGQ4_9MYRT|nr:hypothetical protein SAY87_000106 [Trapa incisa]